MRRIEVRLIRPEQLKGYLVDEFGGVDAGDGWVAGSDWVAHFVEGEPVQIGTVTVPVLFVEFDGPREADAALFLSRKAMRGGG
jgi:hypothetical protein